MGEKEIREHIERRLLNELEAAVVAERERIVTLVREAAQVQGTRKAANALDAIADYIASGGQ